MTKRSLSLAFAFTATVAALTLPATAEERSPQVSPYSQITQRVGLSDVTITFSRPGVKGRKIWGELVPMGKIWRTGANQATTIKFEEDVLVEGKPVAAGTYALFTVPGEKTWSLILNKDAKQWGAYTHRDADDVVKVDVTPRAAASPEEWMTFRFSDLSIDGATIVLSWEKVEVPFRFRNKVETNTVMFARLRDKIAKAKPDEWKPYADAATYCLSQKTNMDEGMKWIDESLAIKATTTGHFVKAMFLDAAGKTKEGVAELQKALKAAGPEDDEAFLDEIKSGISEWTKRAK